MAGGDTLTAGLDDGRRPRVRRRSRRARQPFGSDRLAMYSDADAPPCGCGTNHVTRARHALYREAAMRAGKRGLSPHDNSFVTLLHAARASSGLVGSVPE